MTASFDHSNYETESEAAAGDITDPGTGSNVTTDPAFVNAAAGDFHQLSSSTGTLDLGTATGLDPLERDLDGQYRNQGAAPDIGADELATAPPAPTLTGTSPASGANDNNPKVIGTAEPFSLVTLYPNATCTGLPVGSELAEVLAAPGIPVSVTDDSTTTFSATATNDTDTSPCSTENVTYTEVTTPPPPGTTATPPPAAAPTPKKKCKKKKHRAGAAKKCKKKRK